MSDPLIYDLVKNNYTHFKRHKGLFGIELETETLNNYELPNMTYWNTISDGSLRNYGIEYVLKVPLLYEDLPLAFEEFDGLGFKFLKDSVSTSTHVHVNFLNETMTTMGNFICLYSLIENLLVKISGEDRLSNLFCLPMKDAEENFYNAKTFVSGCAENKYSRMSVSADYTKYAGLNLAAFGRFGSLELRTFRGVTKTSEIKDWIDIINEMVEFSRKNKNPTVFMKEYLKNPENFLSQVFSKDYFVGIDTLGLMEENLWYASTLAFSYKWVTPKVNPPFGIRVLNKESRDNYEKDFANLTAGQQRNIISHLQNLRSMEAIPQEVPRRNPVTFGSLTRVRAEEY